MTRNDFDPHDSPSEPARKEPSDMDPPCSACGMPIRQTSSAVAHYGPKGCTIEHQACWQSRTFGGQR